MTQFKLGENALLIGQERHILDRDRLDGRLTNTLYGVRICCYIFRQNDAGFMVEERLASDSMEGSDILNHEYR